MARIVVRASLSRSSLVFTTLALLSLLSVTSGPAYAGSTIYKTLDGIAIQGYDPVAYFTEDRPVKGSKQYAYDWLGATWHFASAEHRDRFAAEPIKYVPQYGGHCSRGAYAGKIFSGDPEVWRIIDGKLYLFYSQRTLGKFDQDSAGRTGQLDKANANWPKLKAELEAR